MEGGKGQPNGLPLYFDLAFIFQLRGVTVSLIFADIMWERVAQRAAFTGTLVGCLS